MKIKKEKKKGKVLYKIIALMMVGAFGTAIVQNNSFTLENPVNRIVRGLRDEFESIDIVDLDCSEFSCIGVDGVYIEVPEFGSNQGIWIYRYADKSIVKHSVDYYKVVNSMMGMPQTKVYGEGNYFISATNGVSDEHFFKVIEIMKSQTE